MTTYALVHGGCHGAWAWDRLVPELEQRGQRTVTMDLPCEDPAAGASEYADVVVDALSGSDDDVVVVGHSLAGATIPVVASRRPVRRLVFLAALLPEVGSTLAEVRERIPDTMAPGAANTVHEDGSLWVSPEQARRRFYGDCDDATVAWAVARLRRQTLTPYTETCPLTAWPDVAATYVVCEDDGAVSPAWSRRAAREQLGVEPIPIPGSHSPFLSRPAVLADLLVGLPV